MAPDPDHFWANDAEDRTYFGSQLVDDCGSINFFAITVTAQFRAGDHP
jgi:hypothetical protein